jgi:hypothetical protein
MSIEHLAALERHINELEATVRDELAQYTDAQLLELLEAHLKQPTAVVAAAMTRNPGKFAAMAAVPIHRERLRRAEIAAMEAST